MSSARELDKSKSQPWTQEGAPKGMVKNAPHCDIPDGSVAYLRNAHAFPTEFQPRLASRIYTDLQPPVLSGRTGYIAQKDGNIITSLSGNIFVDTDVSLYWVWPDDPAIHDEIQEYISATQVRVRDGGDRPVTVGCWMHGRLNLNDFHASERKKFYLWGQDVYVADSLAIASWTKGLCVSRETPGNAIAASSPFDEYSVFGNSGGIFQLDFDGDSGYPILWKKNTPVPAILPTSTTWSKFNRKRYDHTYGMCRLSQHGLRDRTSDGVKLMQQSGSCALNPNTVPPRDYSTNFLEQKIDRGVKTQGELVCAPVLAINRLPAYWQGLGGAVSAVFRLTVNGQQEEFVIDFGPTGYNSQSMDDVAAAIQDTIKLSFPFATCVWDADHFVFTSGEQDLSTLDYGAPGTSVGYTNISAIINITAASGAVLDNAHAWAAPFEVGVLYVPKVPTEPTLPEQHWTHYSLYRTTNIGAQGVDPKVNEATGEILPPTKLHWVADVRIGGAFYAWRNHAGLVTALVGEFQEYDVGTPLKWEDGDIDTIYSYIDSTHVMVHGTHHDAYYNDANHRQACVIGDGKVFRASQAGHVVTRTHGDSFAVDDVGKTITWSIHNYSIITEFVDANTVLVHDSLDKDVQGATMDPLRRIITDNVPDEILRDREGEVHIGLLQNRFWTHLPNCNILCVVPGFLLVAQRGNKSIWYSQLGTELKYLSGYHLSNRQKIDRVEDAIQTIRKAPNKFLVWCTNSFWGGPTNNPDVKYLPEFGDAYALLYIDVIDARLGCVDIGSIQEVEEGRFELRCTDNSWRQCTPFGYTAELGDMSVQAQTGQDIVKKDFKEAQAISASLYGDNVGHVIWVKGL